MNDTVTIITSATINQIVKSFGDADHQPLKFSHGSEFWVTQHPVHDLQSLASVIGGVKAELTKTVIRGLPLLPENKPVARQSQNFSSTFHHWCMTDIDSLPWDGNLHDHQAMLEYASFHLPLEFQQVLYFSLTNSSSEIKYTAGLLVVNLGFIRFWKAFLNLNCRIANFFPLLCPN